MCILDGVIHFVGERTLTLWGSRPPRQWWGRLQVTVSDKRRFEVGCSRWLQFRCVTNSIKLLYCRVAHKICTRSVTDWLIFMINNKRGQTHKMKDCVSKNYMSKFVQTRKSTLVLSLWKVSLFGETPRGFTSFWQCYGTFHYQEEDRHINNWHQFVKYS